jgi:hypothetical protein
MTPILKHSNMNHHLAGIHPSHIAAESVPLSLQSQRSTDFPKAKKNKRANSLDDFCFGILDKDDELEPDI